MYRALHIRAPIYRALYIGPYIKVPIYRALDIGSLDIGSLNITAAFFLVELKGGRSKRKIADENLQFWYFKLVG